LKLPRFPSLAKLQSTVADIVIEQDRPFGSLKNGAVHGCSDLQEPGQHLRFEDDEDAMKTLLSFHPEGDR
jgi:hypothetical protein